MQKEGAIGTREIREQAGHYLTCKECNLTWKTSKILSLPSYDESNERQEHRHKELKNRKEIALCQSQLHNFSGRSRLERNAKSSALVLVLAVGWALSSDKPCTPASCDVDSAIQVSEPSRQHGLYSSKSSDRLSSAYTDLHDSPSFANHHHALT